MAVQKWLCKEKSRCSTRSGASLSHDHTPGDGRGLRWERRDHSTNAIDYPPKCVREEDQEGSNPTGGAFCLRATLAALPPSIWLSCASLAFSSSACVFSSSASFWPRSASERPARLMLLDNLQVGQLLNCVTASSIVHGALPSNSN